MTVTDHTARADRRMTGHHDRVLGWLYVVCGLAGLVAATALTLEKLAKLADPSYVPTCSLNPVISCGSVMDSSQAAAFGFPNPIIGMAAFPVVITTGVAVLTGFHRPRWFRLGMQAGTTLGIVFVHWLIAASLYDIGALCPYCMVVWATMIPLFTYTTIDTLITFDRTHAAATALRRFHSAIPVAWNAVVAVLVLLAFWDYWLSLV